MLGSWNVGVITGGMPESIATAVGKLGEQLVGAEYTPIAYLGSQVVNGTNHAVLAEQTVITGKDTKNIVVLIFNEKQQADKLPEVTLVNIERVLEGGNGMGGLKIDAAIDIPAEAQAAFDSVMKGFVGSTVKPFAYLGEQVVKGINYVLAAEVTPVYPDAATSVCIVTVNSMVNKINFADILESKHALSLGAPLGEWP